MSRSSIAKELFQAQPFSTPDQKAVVALLRTADSVYRAVGAVTGTEGLSMEQYNVLRILRMAGFNRAQRTEFLKMLTQIRENEG